MSKRVLLILFATLLMGGCSNALQVFEIDARTKDVALENMVLISDGKEFYVQPTYDVFTIEKLNGEIREITGASILLSDRNHNVIFSTSIGENQDGILDTRTIPTVDYLVGTIGKSEFLKQGEKIFIEFQYIKDSKKVIEELEIILTDESH